MKLPARKYRNVPTMIDGIRFASKREAKRYSELRLLQRAGQISNLEVQPAFKFEVNGRPVLIRSNGYPNGRQAKYVADFAYWDGEKRVVEDSKGFSTPEYKLKKALVEALFPAVRIVEV
ncbi:DUF1064 domain-containing protein [Mesorhizobium sp. M8A.F.Ca.ET.173.01.1.1]|nr:DUF1064 domain-containing protein [Mesorhizobium sp. M8A.F.Ca.ET.173.01.1.1]